MRTISKLVTLAGAGAMLVPAAPALAGDVAAQDGSNPVVATGTCTAGTTWELAAVARNRGIGVRYTLDSATAGQRWLLVGAHNRASIVARTRRTDADGNIVVGRRTRNLPGVDTFRVFARNRVTKEVCRASLSY